MINNTKKNYVFGICLIAGLASCGNESDRVGNVDDTAMTAPATGNEMSGQGRTDSSMATGDSMQRQSLTDTSYHIGDSAR